jgi:hypothetical protein
MLFWACRFVSGFLKVSRRRKMHPSPSIRLRIAVWAVTILLPCAAWQLTNAPGIAPHLPVGVFFLAAAVISAAIGGLIPALISYQLNISAL